MGQDVLAPVFQPDSIGLQCQNIENDRLCCRSCYTSRGVGVEFEIHNLIDHDFLMLDSSS